MRKARFQKYYEDAWGFWRRRSPNRKMSMENVWKEIIREIEKSDDDYLPF